MTLAGAGCEPFLVCGSVDANATMVQKIAIGDFIDFSLFDRRPRTGCAEWRGMRNLAVTIDYGPFGVTVIGVALFLPELIGCSYRPDLRLDHRSLRRRGGSTGRRIVRGGRVFLAIV